MNKSQIRLAQESLNDENLQAGPVDGIFGENTRRALDHALDRREAKLPNVWRGWPNKRKLVAYLQLLSFERGIEVGTIDGLWGPQTEFAYDSLVYFRAHGNLPPAWREVEPADLNPNRWPHQAEAELVRFYGEVGKHQTRIAAPYPHKLSWELSKKVTSFSCHEKVHDSLQRVLTRVLDHYGQEQISTLRLDHWGGCLNVRKKRGGTTWSTHSWGIALDYDPARNRLKWGRDRAHLARPEYDRWWQLWEEEGWLSLGRARNFDWMHVQAAKL